MMSWLKKLEPPFLSVLRIVAGFLFWQHGVQKLLGWFGGDASPAFSLFWFAGVVETLGGPLITLGLLTRPVAFLLAGEMLVAYLIAHAPEGPWPRANGGVQALQFLVIFLHLAAAGSGPLALDSFVSARSQMKNIFSRFELFTRTLLRVMAGFLFWQYGAAKLIGFLGGRPAEFPNLRWFAGVLEFFGGPLIALGLFTRGLAFILSGEMAVAFWTGHVPRGQGFWPIQNGGEPAVLFCFIYLYLMAAGPGRWSLDGLCFRKES
jgi:putative oxidoreductase